MSLEMLRMMWSSLRSRSRASAACRLRPALPVISSLTLQAVSRVLSTACRSSFSDSRSGSGSVRSRFSSSFNSAASRLISCAKFPAVVVIAQQHPVIGILTLVRGDCSRQRAQCSHPGNRFRRSLIGQLRMGVPASHWERASIPPESARVGFSKIDSRGSQITRARKYQACPWRLFCRHSARCASKRQDIPLDCAACRLRSYRSLGPGILLRRGRNSSRDLPPESRRKSAKAGLISDLSDHQITFVSR